MVSCATNGPEKFMVGFRLCMECRKVPGNASFYAQCNCKRNAHHSCDIKRHRLFINNMSMINSNRSSLIVSVSSMYGLWWPFSLPALPRGLGTTGFMLPMTTAHSHRGVDRVNWQLTIQWPDQKLCGRLTVMTSSTAFLCYNGKTTLISDGIDLARLEMLARAGNLRKHLKDFPLDLLYNDFSVGNYNFTKKNQSKNSFNLLYSEE